MWEERSSTTSWPARVWLTTDTRLPIVPEATKSPAALPSRSAATASRRLTVGAPPPPPPPPLGPLALREVHLGEQVERLGDHERPRVVLQDELETLARRGDVALGEVVGGAPELLRREPAAADVDLRERVGRVAALRVLLDELPELLHRLDREPLVLLVGLELVVVAHPEPVLDEVGDLVPREEGQERLELLDRARELALAVEGLADEEARPGRERGVRMALDELAGVLPPLVVAVAILLRLSELGQVLGRRE